MPVINVKLVTRVKTKKGRGLLKLIFEREALTKLSNLMALKKTLCRLGLKFRLSSDSNQD